MARKKYSVEFPFRAKQELIYNYISTATGLNEWFADDVNVNGKIYTFIWDGAEEKAEVLTRKMNKSCKYRWIDRDEDEYVEFNLVKDELTNEVTLLITDFDEEDDIEDAKAVWKVSIDQLKSIIGG